MTATPDATAHWHVLGAGAIGTLFAAQLQRAGHPVSLVLRPQEPAPRTVDIILERDETQYALSFPAVTPAQTDSDEPCIQHLLVTTKAYDVCPAVNTLAPMLAPDCQVLLLTNGMGLMQRLHASHPGLNLYCGTTTEGAYRQSRRHVVHAGQGETRVGKDPTATPPLWFGGWQRAIANSRWDIEIESALWMKLAINCVINPLTALHRCRNGELASQPQYREEVAQLCEEVQQVSYAAGFTQTAQTLHKAVAEVIAATARNQSSMLQDVINGRRTEIEHITGYLLQEALRYGIRTPHNAALMERILAL